jgi:hypothetical protein
MTTPFCLGFNATLWEIVKELMPDGFDVSPNTFEALQAYWLKHKRVCVWDGASSDTIFGNEPTNWAFRAWHDYGHILTKGDFSLEGEVAVAHWQIAILEQHVETRLAKTPWLVSRHWDARLRFWKRLIQVEVIEHFERTGEFPVNQRQFARKRLGV